MRRRLAGTAAPADAGLWEELATRALTALPLHRALPRRAVYHLRAMTRDVLVAEHEVYGPLYDLVAAVLAIGAAPE
jgi:hypothetical protein